MIMNHIKKHSIRNLAIFFLIISTTIFFIISNFSNQNNVTNPPLVQKDDLQIALENASMPNNTVIIVVINKDYVEPHEDEYPTMFDLFLEGFWAGEDTRKLVEHLLVVAMDQVAYERCLYRGLNCYKLVADGGDDEFSGEKLYMSKEFIEMMWRRTLFLLNVLKKGYNFIFTDADVIWLRNPFPKLMKNETMDFQISTDVFKGNFSSKWNRINSGFYFIKSNNKTISLFDKWYDMRTNSTGMKEQDVLIKLIRKNTLDHLGIQTIYHDTVYFSGFCQVSKDIGKVITVHANCCRTIGAKVADLKLVLKDWKKFKKTNVIKSVDDRDSRHGGSNVSDTFQWSGHMACKNSWGNKTLGLELR